ncbi:MAG TPA: HEAT repeat domain-containing protein [Gemmataceae bacterium]|nr:HEAT repeat domain-containing protein [Gemmataceae bacterium]
MRRRVWIVGGIVALALAALSIPGSPVYLLDILFGSGQYEGRSVRQWKRQLGTDDAPERSKAAFALGAMGADARSAVPELARVLTDDPDRACRIEASLAISKIAPACAEAVPALAKALSDPELFVRMNAAMALFRLKHEARPAVPELIRAVQDEKNKTNLGAFHHTIQDMAGLALGRASAGSADGVAALTDALAAATSVESQSHLARALGEVGPPARSAAPQLRALLTDESALVRESAGAALDKIGELREPIPIRGHGPEARK